MKKELISDEYVKQEEVNRDVKALMDFWVISMVGPPSGTLSSRWYPQHPTRRDFLSFMDHSTQMLNVKIGSKKCFIVPKSGRFSVMRDPSNMFAAYGRCVCHDNKDCLFYILWIFKWIRWTPLSSLSKTVIKEKERKIRETLSIGQCGLFSAEYFQQDLWFCLKGILSPVGHFVICEGLTWKRDWYMIGLT